MAEKSTLKKINKIKFFLNKIVANKIENEPEEMNIDLALETDYIARKKTDDELIIESTVKVFLEPEALFFIELEYITEIKLLESISDEEIDDGIDELLSQLGSEASYMISTLTKKIIGTYIILPPIISFKKSKD